MENVQLSGGAPGQGDRVCELLTTVLEVLAEAGGVRGWDGSAEVVRARVGLAQRVVAVAESVRLTVLRQVQARPELVPGGETGKTAAAVLVGGCRVDPRAAARDVAVAEALDPDGEVLPTLGAAFAAGEVSREHVNIATSAVNRIPVGVKKKVLPDGRTGLGWIDAFLTEFCREHPPGTVRQLVQEMLQILDPDRQAPDDGARRGLSYRTEAGSGMVVGSFALTPAEGLEVVAALEALAAPAPDGTAVDADGQEHVMPDLRSRPQRLADALHAMAEIAMGTPSPHHRATPTNIGTTAATGDEAAAGGENAGDETAADGEGAAASTETGSRRAGESGGSGRESVVGRRARADLSIIVGWEQLVAAGLAPHLPAEVMARARAAGLASMGLAGGSDRPGSCLAPATLARLACDGLWRRVIVGPSGAPLDLGRTQRTASAAQRAALLVRDGGCVVPGCAMPVSWSDIHHDLPWARGGRTDLDNLYPACGRHHTQIHAGVWQVEWRDGLPWVRPPAAIDPARPLLRNTTRDARHAARALAQQLTLDLEPEPDLDLDLDLDTNLPRDRGQGGGDDGPRHNTGRRSSDCRLRTGRTGAVPAPRPRPPTPRPRIDLCRGTPTRPRVWVERSRHVYRAPSSDRSSRSP